MARRLTEDERKDKYSYYTMESPLKSALNDLQLKKSIGNPKNSKHATRQRDFILDGVHEQVHNPNVIPSYNAHRDPHAITYFRQPAIRDMLRKAAVTGNGQLIPPAVESLKLSTRRRIPSTPGGIDLVKKESRFVIDSIRSDSLKTRRFPVIPQYDALNDLHAQNYFKKKSVRSLLRQTCQLKM